MIIEELEQRYHRLAADFRAGRIDPAGFARALDELYYVDEAGRYWTLGAQSGAWYYYDGQSWQPGQLSPARRCSITENRPAMKEARPGRRGWATLAMLLAILALLPLVMLPAVGAAPGVLPPPAPSPRPPLSSGSGGGGGGGGGGGRSSAISGIVTDLSTGRPGEGIEVVVSGQVVRTDGRGHYSITGLAAGSYTVAPELRGRGTPAQGPVFVNLDGGNSQVVDLGFYSQAPPTDTPAPPTPRPTLTVVPVSVRATPIILPPSGGAIGHRPPLLAGLGLLLLLSGLLLKQLTMSNEQREA